MKNLLLILTLFFFIGIFYSCNEEYPSIEDIEEEIEVPDYEKIESEILNLFDIWNEGCQNQDFSKLVSVAYNESDFHDYARFQKMAWEAGEQSSMIFSEINLKEINIEKKNSIVKTFCKFTEMGSYWIVDCEVNIKNECENWQGGWKLFDFGFYNLIEEYLNKIPVAFFVTNNLFGRIGEEFIFNPIETRDVEDDLTDLIFEWDFYGEGNFSYVTSGEKNNELVSHTYDSPGNYKVVLKVIDTGGCIDTYEQLIEVSYFGSFIDPRDNQIYRTIKIGEQEWFADNLNYYHIDSRYYGQDSLNHSYLGRLYRKPTAMIVCPSGWHLPTLEEFEELVNYLGGENVAGGKMKSLEFWVSPNLEATNLSYFSGLPAGTGNSDGEWTNMGLRTMFWTCSYIDLPSNGRCLRLRYDMSTATLLVAPENYYFSVRPIKD